MRLPAIALIVGLATGGALAQTAQPSTPAPLLAEAWVGTWTGKVTWKECSLETGPKLALPIQALAGTLTSDGDLLYEGLGAVVWAKDGDGLEVLRDGFSLTLTPAKKGAVKLQMKTEAGCTATATLKRGSSGMPSCDAVRALATVKASCGELDEATRGEDLEQVEGAWKGWSKLKGKKKKAQAKACTTQLSGLRTEVASCAPAGSVIVAGSGCAGLVAAIDKLIACPALGQDMRDQIRVAFEQYKEMLKSMRDEDCDLQLQQMGEAFAQLGCPL